MSKSRFDILKNLKFSLSKKVEIEKEKKIEEEKVAPIDKTPIKVQNENWEKPSPDEDEE